MTGPQKFLYAIQGWWSCISWILVELIKEYFPDLNLLEIPTHPSDFAWYAERVNGRLAMLAVVAILNIDFFTKDSIWHVIHVL